MHRGFRQNNRETVMIDALPLAFIVLAVGVPVLIGATILGSRV
jgi:hypothetical protein